MLITNHQFSDISSESFFSKYFRSGHFQHKMDIIWLLVSKNFQIKNPKCTQKEWETCLIWSVVAKMDQWQDITTLSWYCFRLEIKQHKAVLACLEASKVCDLVYRQRLHHCMEEMCMLEREEEQRLMVASIWKSHLRPCPG